MALFVLGAGATRGASFVERRPGTISLGAQSTRGEEPLNLVLPPLDTDFYSQLQKIRTAKHRDTVDRVIEDTVDMFGANFNVTLETVFTTLEHTIRMVEKTGDTRDFKRKQLRERRQRLIQAIAAVMEESMCERGTRTPLKCAYHRAIAKSLSSGDAVVSFNYDLLMDHSLKEHGDGRWNPKYGYGFKRGRGSPGLTGHKEWGPTPPLAKQRDTIRYFKLHGSLHFSADEKSGAVALKARPYTKQKGTLKFTIIPPESNKDFDRGVFGDLWKAAGQAIHRATSLVFIGYSMPATDLHSAALFRVSVAKDRIRSLVIVNPDRDARRRTRDVVRRGLCRSSRVVVFSSLREFVECEREVWDADLWPPKLVRPLAKRVRIKRGGLPRVGSRGGSG